MWHDARECWPQAACPPCSLMVTRCTPPAILEAFGNRNQVARRARSTGRRPNPKVRRPQGPVYAQVKEDYAGRRAAWVEIRPIFGKRKLAAVLKKLGSNQVNVSAIERHNGTIRQRARRQCRKSLAFSKEGRYHGWLGWLLHCIIIATIIVV